VKEDKNGNEFIALFNTSHVDRIEKQEKLHSANLIKSSCAIMLQAAYINAENKSINMSRVRGPKKKKKNCVRGGTGG